MAEGPLSVALEDEHRAIDAGLAPPGPGQGIASDALAQAIAALRRHIYVEEALLFPPLREAGFVAPIFVMLREHGEIWRDLDALEHEAAGGVVDQAQLDLYRRLAERLHAHNLKEEQILYPQADVQLSDQQRGDLATFLESGRMPDGWTCARAASG